MSDMRKMELCKENTGDRDKWKCRTRVADLK